MERTVSLLELYGYVPAAQEEDLLQQLAAEQQERWLVQLYALEADADPPPTRADGAPDAGQPDEVPPTHAQALGIVQHLLGARVLDDQQHHRPQGPAA